MRRIKRGVLGLLLLPTVFTAAFSGASSSISAFAVEKTDLKNSDENANTGYIPLIEEIENDSNVDVEENSQPKSDNLESAGDVLIKQDPDNAGEDVSSDDQDKVINNVSSNDQDKDINDISSNDQDKDINDISSNVQNKDDYDVSSNVQNKDDYDVSSFDQKEANYDVSSFDQSAASYDVCFYIRGASIGAEIPREPQHHFGELYSSAIRINDAVTAENLSLSDHEENGNEDFLLSDNFTAANPVSEMLSTLPDASAIKAVVPEFDETRHYVVWYVMKSALSTYPNWDVYLHVDGVIRERPASTNKADERPAPTDKADDFTPQEIEALAELGREVEIEIEALFLDEDGNEVKEIPYDGKEHLVGGFAINVLDSERHSLLEQLRYNYKGELITYAADDCTYFSVRDRLFSVNITGAYAMAKDLGEAVISFYSGSTKLNGPEDIRISDEKGRSITSFLNVLPRTGSVSVTQPLTLEAGTTVRNDNGQTLTDDSYEITNGSLLDGHRIDSVVILGSQTGAGESSNEITSVVIVDSAGNDVTNRYHIDTVKGRLVLVDAKDKKEASGENAEAGNSDTSASKEAKAVASASDKTSAATNANGVSLTSAPAPLINYETVKIETVDDKTTIMKVQYDFGAANVTDNAPSVLGARMSATGDNNTASTRIMLILVSLVTVFTIVSHFRNGSEKKDEKEDEKDAA